MKPIETTLTIEEFAENLAAIVEQVADSRERVLVEASNGTRVQIAPVLHSLDSEETLASEEQAPDAADRHVYLSLSRSPIDRREVEKVADDVFASEREGITFHASLDDFDYLHDALTTRMREQNEFMKLVNRGGTEMEFGFEKFVPYDGSMEASDKWRAFAATFGTMSDEEADELELYIADGRSVPRREYDFS